MKDNSDLIYKEIYEKARASIKEEKLNPIDFATALINVSKLILVEEVGPKDAQILFDFANKSFIIESEQITYH